MQNNRFIRKQDLVNNPLARIPVCLCLDTSGSMSGIPIEELNKGVKLFYEAIREDEKARYAAEISVVVFNDTATCMIDFANIDRQTETLHLDAIGLTYMGEGINLALDLLEERKGEYKDSGVDYYQPWLILMTDGAPNGKTAELERAINRTIEAVKKQKLTIFPIGVGEDADMQVLEKFSPYRQPLRLRELKFREFFIWLGQSISRTSQSSVGEKVSLDTDSIFKSDGGWGSL